MGGGRRGGVVDNLFYVVDLYYIIENFYFRYYIIVIDKLIFSIIIVLGVEFIFLGKLLLNLG